MTYPPSPMCMWCEHFDRQNLDGENPLSCTAFPGGIPRPILLSEIDHRKPYPSDGSIRFSPRPDAPARFK